MSRAVDAELLRKRSVGAPATRSTLLTILGEYVAPGDREVYRDGLVRALEATGYRTQAARQALARSVADGWLISRRVGRRAIMRVTPQTRSMLSAGYPRIYGFGEPWEWDGRWLLVVVRVAEEQRDVRDRLRTKLAWAGFGSLGGGVWISPHLDRESEVHDAVGGDEDAAVLLFSADQLGRATDVRTTVHEAWDLNAIADQYISFVDDFSSTTVADEREAFAAQTAMVHAWRKFPFVDPDLPDELLPDDWPRARALALFQERHAAWQPAAEAFFTAL
jgi:phenylacetic acid degradation operon negative regulatory protein